MIPKSNRRIKIQTSQFEKTYIPNSSAGLAKSHRLIRIEKEKEILFMKICSQIRLDDFKKTRSDKQREDRKLKRRKSICSLTNN